MNTVYFILWITKKNQNNYRPLVKLLDFEKLHILGIEEDVFFGVSFESCSCLLIESGSIL